MTRFATVGLCILILGGCARRVPPPSLSTPLCDVNADAPVPAAPMIFVATSRVAACEDDRLVLTTERVAAPLSGAIRHAVATPGVKDPRIATTAGAAWRDRVASDAAANGGRVLLFIHGYNSDAFDALDRADRIAAAADFSGPIVTFTWPSQKRALRYGWDEENVRWGQIYANALLRDVAAAAPHVVLVAHSMGNRVALDALTTLGRTDPALAERISTVVLASPDVDLDIFERDFIAEIARPGRSVTVYGSRRDRALQLSGTVHGYQRLGDVSCKFRHPPVKDRKDSRCYPAKSDAGMTYVDTSTVAASGIGHDDFVRSAVMRADLCRVIRGRPTDRLPTTTPGIATPNTGGRKTVAIAYEGPLRLRAPALPPKEAPPPPRGDVLCDWWARQGLKP